MIARPASILVAASVAAAACTHAARYSPDPRTACSTGDTTTIAAKGPTFPYCGYLRNLVTQVYRRWRPPASEGSLSAEISFVLHRDGSVTSVEFVRRSGSSAFDLSAERAVEAAAQALAFGQLPAGYAADTLPVSFYFNPARRQ